MKQNSRDEACPRKGKKRFSTRTLILTILLSMLATVTIFCGTAWAVLGEDGLSVLEAALTIRTQFVGEYDARKATDETLDRMVDSLGDRWSYYLTKEEFKQVMDTRRNSYVGIGVTIDRNWAEGLKILSVIENGPAKQAGLKAGEIIQAVNGTAVTQDNRAESMDCIRGEVGSGVALKVMDPAGTVRTVTVIRDTVKTQSVAYKMLKNEVGLVTIHNFYADSGKTLIEAVNALQEQGATALVFDVRNNPGGYVTELTKMLDYLLPEGKIFVSRDIHGEETVYESDEASVALPISVLVNGDSYSAAEFFAAQLRESAHAVVAGVQTCGKGFAQQIFPLMNGGALGISTSRYFTGGGISLIGTGITPDPLVPLTEDQKWLLQMNELPSQEDPQLQAALTALQIQN